MHNENVDHVIEHHQSVKNNEIIYISDKLIELDKVKFSGGIPDIERQLSNILSFEATNSK